MDAVALVLVVAGAVAELVGVGLAVAGIVSDRRKAKALFAHKLVRIGAARGYASGRTLGTLTGGRDPTTAERVAAVEQRLVALEESVSERFLESLKRTDAKIDEAVQAAYSRADELDQEMREHLSDVLAGSARGSAVGAALVATGIVLSVPGSIVGMS